MAAFLCNHKALGSGSPQTRMEFHQQSKSHIQMGLEPHDLSSPSSSSSLSVTPTITSAKTSSGEGLRLPHTHHTCPRPHHHSCPSPGLVSTCTWPLRTSLSHLSSSLRGQTHLCSPKFSQDGAESQEGKWAECPVGDAKHANLLPDLSYTPLNPPSVLWSLVLSSAVTSFLLILLEKVKPCCLSLGAAGCVRK